MFMIATDVPRQDLFPLSRTPQVSLPHPSRVRRVNFSCPRPSPDQLSWSSHVIVSSSPSKLKDGRPGAFQAATERSRMSCMFRNSGQSQNSPVPAFILLKLPQENTSRRRNDGMSCLSDFRVDPRNSDRLTNIFSSQSIVGYSSTQRQWYRGSEMRHLRRNAHSNLLLFCVREIHVYSLFWFSSTHKWHSWSSQCFDWEFASTASLRVNPCTNLLFTEMPRAKRTVKILLPAMQSLHLPEMLRSGSWPTRHDRYSWSCQQR